MTQNASSNQQSNLAPLGISEKLRALHANLRGPGLRAASLRGSILSALGFSAQKVIQLISNLILTRILFPEAFGVMALACTFLAGITMFGDIGLHQAIVQSKRGDEKDYLNTAWTIKVIRGFAIWLAACILAWPISQIYQQTILFPLLCVLGVSAAIQGFASIGLSTLNRKLQFKRLVILDLVRAVISTLVTIAMALWLKSVWSLVIGTIVGSLIGTVLSHRYLTNHIHRLCWDRSSLVEIIRFGRWIMLATLANFFGSAGQPLIQGYFVSAETLGFLAIAMTFVDAVDDLGEKLLSSVGFPALSRVVRESPHSLDRVVAQLKLISNGIGVAAFLFLSLIASLLIEILYDPRYMEAGQYMAILAVNGAVMFLQVLYMNVALAKGDSRTHFIMKVTVAITSNAGLLIGYQAGGVLGMLYGLTLGSLVGYIVICYVAYRNDYACIKADALALTFIGLYVALAYT
ncbi:oligosaccharide flippase family protein [Microbulbifer marinus]|uniref:Membrane protein involved in the export of O-antigen and teichoic acid n=1 Tax=Microbulbifer marinus TaxID=658218 RepID=A0A1H3YSE3_9GAMM|nr:oligosaccharide flippase family protein [Microbulbifer marinus]SEA13954.1 Membrane protein involved in the export of O-antigen and teichoic acid [Microbulbifer marinus]